MRLATRSSIGNIAAVARREFIYRANTRTYLVTTIILILAAVLVGLAPVVVSYFDRGAARVAVYVGAPDLRGDPISLLDALLNPADSSKKEVEVSQSTDLAADRQLVLDGKITALVDIERDSAGQLVFTVYTTEPAGGPTAVISRQAAASIAIADRLDHTSLTPQEQAGLFVPPQVTVRSPDLSKPPVDSQAIAQELADAGIMTALELFLLLAIVLYGTWVAQSVVEEKSSRMMEIILAAASPFQLLAGKVIGVSAVALLQFVVVVAAALAALFAQGQIASFVLGQDAGFSLPTGLTPSLMVAFSVFFILGFVLYAVLFAAAGSLVSRQEDVGQMIMPMTLLGSAGYIIALYASIGLFDPNAGWVVALSWVPLLSPYMMLSRLQAGTAGFVEVSLSVALLLVTIVLAIWIAARIYSAGVLMYGQKPGIRPMLKALREGR